MVRRILDNSFVSLTGKKGQHGPTVFGNRFLPQPSEAYSFWDIYTGQDFSRSYLRDQTADKSTVHRVHRAVGKLLAWQGRARFAAKITGPSRMAFLSSIFPDAKFVHIIRDGRAAVHSLLHVAFWREKGGLSKPFWRGGLSDADLQKWWESQQDPGVLAALQWKRVIEIARLESGTLENVGYQEIRYEDFVESPHVALRKMYSFCDLEDALLAHRHLERRDTLVNMNDKYRTDFGVVRIEKLSALMEPMLGSLGYSSSIT